MRGDDRLLLTCGYSTDSIIQVEMTREQYLRMYVESITQGAIASCAIEGEILSEQEIEFLYQDTERRIQRALARMNAKASP